MPRRNRDDPVIFGQGASWWLLKPTTPGRADVTLNNVPVEAAVHLIASARACRGIPAAALADGYIAELQALAEYVAASRRGDAEARAAAQAVLRMRGAIRREAA
jgi:hypothetical protein